jgi:hypothetical protein
MTFYNDLLASSSVSKIFIHGVNLTGFQIQHAVSSRFDISRLQHVFARALPDSRTVSATVPGTDPHSFRRG